MKKQGSREGTKGMRIRSVPIETLRSERGAEQDEQGQTTGNCRREHRCAEGCRRTGPSHRPADESAVSSAAGGPARTGPLEEGAGPSRGGQRAGTADPVRADARRGGGSAALVLPELSAGRADGRHAVAALSDGGPARRVQRRGGRLRAYCGDAHFPGRDKASVSFL